MKNCLIQISLFLLSFGSVTGQDLKINELMSSNEVSSFDSFGEASDWLEIYNNGNNSIQLSDYYLSNNFSDKLKWQFPSISLPANSWLLVYCSNRNIRVTEYHANFKLSNSSDSIGIFYKDGSTIDVLVYDSLPTDVSFGLKPDGSTNRNFFLNSTPNSTNNNSNGYSCLLQPPVISSVSGFYSSPHSVNITHAEPGVEIRFTENGNKPSSSSTLYSGTLGLTTNEDTNRLSLIPTNPGVNAPMGLYSVVRSNTRGYVPPAVDVQNINVLKVKAFKTGCLASEEVSRTYLLANGSTHFPTTPIISIQVDSVDLFSSDTGMYVYGKRSNGNYLERGEEWERESQMVYFDENQNILINQKLGIELHGNGSRHSTHKNFRISAKSIYGKSKIKAPLFGNYRIDEFKKLIVRSPGHRPDCMPRDELATSMVANLSFDIQHYSRSVLYLNGEYWGINVLKERFDEDFVSLKYDINEDEIVILEGKGVVSYGDVSDEDHYYDMLDFVTNNNLDIPANMTYLNTQMDVNNYLEFMISQIQIGNGDWPTNNMRFWRKRVDYGDFSSLGHDGRWRWMFFDLDGGFGGTCSDVYYTINNLERALDDSPSSASHTRLFRDLTSYQSFRELFINKTCDLLNSTFTNSVMNAKLDESINGINPLMVDHTNRFGYPSTSTTLADRLLETPSLDQWNYLVSRFGKFMDRRNRFIKRDMMLEWSLGDTLNITLDVNDLAMGYVQLNSLHVNSELEGVSSVVYPWTGMYYEGIEIPLIAHAYPGYRFKEWVGTAMKTADTSIIISSDTGFVALFEIDPNYIPQLPISINELQAKNSSTVFDEYYEYDDWIELYNPNANDVDITGYYLTDDRDDLKKYLIGPTSVSIPGKDWLVFWADDQTEQGLNHLNFGLSKDGEYVALVAPDGVTVIDSINFGPQVEDYSFGRQTDGMTPWVEFIAPTPFYSNLSTDVSELTSEISLIVYPNPSNGSVIYFNKSISGSIYTISGILIKDISKSNSFEISDLSTGIYIIRDSKTGESVKWIKR